MMNRPFRPGLSCSFPGCEFVSRGRDPIEAAYDLRMHKQNAHARPDLPTSTSTRETRGMSLPPMRPFFDTKAKIWVYVCNFPGCRHTDVDYNALVRHIQTTHDDSRENYRLARTAIANLYFPPPRQVA